MNTTASSPKGSPHSQLRAWVVWGLVTLFVIFLFNVQTGYAIVNPDVQKTLGLSLRQVSIIASIYTWAFAICQFFGGPLLDRLGARKVIIPAIGLVTTGTFIFSLSTNFALLAFSQLVLALGACVGFVGAGYIGGKWFGMAKYGIMFGLVQSVVSFSSAFGQTGISLALHETTWRHLFWDAALFGVVLTAIAIVLLRDPAPIEKVTGSFFSAVTGNLLDVMKVPHVWIAAFWGAACFGTQLALGVIWGPKLFIANGVSVEMANLCTAMVWCGLGLGCLFWNNWSEHIKARKLPAIAGLALQIVMLLVILFIPVTRPSLGLVIMLLLGMGSSGHMIAFSTAADVVPSKDIGTSASFVNGAMFIMAGILVAIPGHLLPTEITGMTDYRLAFAPLMVLLVLALILAAIQKETYPSS